MPNCRDCKSQIKFAKLGERSIPVDATQASDGSFVLFHESGVLSARPARLPADQMRPRHKLHFDTCKSHRYGRNSQQ